MVGGYSGKLLRVDLTAGTCKPGPLPSEDVLRKYIGGIGLGMRLLMDETPAHVKATDPEAPLMLMTGPLSGTTAPSSSNLAVVCLNYDTPYAVATGHSHGFWAAYLRHAGWDGIVVTGRAEKPVYLWVDDDKVEIRDAAGVWGKDTRETERLIKRELGDEEKISVCCIGPAGEAMLPGASIKNDRNHGAHKGSVGAIMGSKLLKAVAVRGTQQVPLVDREAFMNVTKKWDDSIKAERGPGEGAPAVGSLLADGGITRIYTYVGQKHMVGCKNYTDPIWGEGYSKGYVDRAADPEMARRVTDLDAVDVVTDPSTHHHIVCLALDLGLHVMVEKPMAITVKACHQMIEAANRNDRKLSVAENFRRDPSARLVRHLLDSGAIGRPYVATNHALGGYRQIFITPWRHLKEKGGFILDEGVHYTDLIRYQLGDIAEVYGDVRLVEPVRKKRDSVLNPYEFYQKRFKAMPEDTLRRLPHSLPTVEFSKI